MSLNSKQRAYLRGLAQKVDPVVYIGKDSLTPQSTKSIEEALAARELVKVSVQKNCLDDVRSLAEAASERTRSDLVTVIGRKFVLYKMAKPDKRKIELP